MAVDRARRWEYDEQGRMIAEHLPDGSQIQAAYNEDGDLLTLIDEKGACWRSDYDERGNLLAGTDPTGVTSRYQYDEYGQLSAADVPGSGQSRYRYDRFGFLQALRPAREPLNCGIPRAAPCWSVLTPAAAAAVSTGTARIGWWRWSIRRAAKFASLTTGKIHRFTSPMKPAR